MIVGALAHDKFGRKVPKVRGREGQFDDLASAIDCKALRVVRNGGQVQVCHVYPSTARQLEAELNAAPLIEQRTMVGLAWELRAHMRQHAVHHSHIMYERRQKAVAQGANTELVGASTGGFLKLLGH